jgi:hypothetical protein
MIEEFLNKSNADRADHRAGRQQGYRSRSPSDDVYQIMQGPANIRADPDHPQRTADLRVNPLSAAGSGTSPARGTESGRNG